MNKMDIVIPTYRRDWHTFVRFCNSVLKNYSLLNRVWVMVSDAEYPEYRERIKSPHLTLVPASTLLPGVPYDFPGIRRQQMLKLAAAKVVETDFYLVMDSDTMVIRSFDEAELFENGQARYMVEADGHHFDWTLQAQDFLKLDSPEQSCYGSYSVTTAIFHRQNVKDLFSYIEKVHEKPWQTKLMENNWTEFQLYGIFSDCVLGSRYHVFLPHTQWLVTKIVRYSKKTPWLPHDVSERNQDLNAILEDWNPTAADLKKIFLVIQSNTRESLVSMPMGPSFRARIQRRVMRTLGITGDAVYERIVKNKLRKLGVNFDLEALGK